MEPKANKGGVYKHQNGRLYLVSDLIWDGERDVWAVLHVDIDTGKQCVRSLENFFGLHKSGEPRFKFVETV